MKFLGHKKFYSSSTRRTERGASLVESAIALPLLLLLLMALADAVTALNMSMRLKDGMVSAALREDNLYSRANSRTTEIAATSLVSLSVETAKLVTKAEVAAMIEAAAAESEDSAVAKEAFNVLQSSTRVAQGEDAKSKMSYGKLPISVKLKAGERNCWVEPLSRAGPGRGRAVTKCVYSGLLGFLYQFQASVNTIFDVN